MLDERRRATLTHLQVYQNWLKWIYNKKFWVHHFEVGDLVLKMNYKTQKHREKQGKFEPKWEEPYVVTASFGSRVYQLATLDGELLPISINNMHLHKYYTWFYLKFLKKYQKKGKKVLKKEKKKEKKVMKKWMPWWKPRKQASWHKNLSHEKKFVHKWKPNKQALWASTMLKTWQTSTMCS